MSAASITDGQTLTGVMFNEPMRVVTTQQGGAGSVIAGLVGQNSGQFRDVSLTEDDLFRLTTIDDASSYDGDGDLLKLALQAYSLGIAHEFDSYFGLSISKVDPLPHQLEAVYEYLMTNGVWHTKMGRGPVIKHRSPESLSEGPYDRPTVHMA